MTARTLFTNATFLTMDPARPLAEALLVRAGRVERAGRAADLRAAAPGAHVVDLGGRFALPGFIDAHNHFSLTALEPLSIDCRTPPSTAMRDLLARVERTAATAPPGRWLRGHGYDDALLGGHPTRAQLDSVAPDHPVVLAHVSLHRCAVNSAALHALGLGDATADPPGGWAVRDPDGTLTGVLYERAADPLQAASLAAYVEAYRDQLPGLFRTNAAAQHAQGITGLGDTYVNQALAPVYAAAALPLTVRPYCGSSAGLLAPPEECIAPAPPEALGRLLARGVKLFADGGGNTTATSLADGRLPRFLFYQQERLNGLVAAAHGAGLPIAIHAAGDIAVGMALDAFAHARRAYPHTPPRFRIEHAITLREGDIPRFRELGVPLVSQPEALYHGGARLGRAGLAPGVLVLPYRALLDAGVALAFSSDSPCFALPPLWQAWCAITRATADGARADGQSVSVEEALRAFTVAGAAAIGDPDGGALIPGRHADFAVLSHDPRMLPLDRWQALRVEEISVDGARVPLPATPGGMPGRPLPAAAQWGQSSA
jgi:predicted amidohydrolase YtcJ